MVHSSTSLCVLRLHDRYHNYLQAGTGALKGLRLEIRCESGHIWRIGLHIGLIDMPYQPQYVANVTVVSRHPVCATLLIG